ncbi:hypothetical protein FJ930_19790 [Mesorhizobium sp. B2-4-15]|uniref:hypothetical protein n=1 Tax=Mesorhizobium sp. B2-4-15 TaxID=2589934 RepID=UPI00115045A6|nr:hypothetical protein [Mesorhizobium sp. B2-4-15]TPK70211.1 hypothetical protein FJ930_19790 [Mesorhizobium sp. B2-4-15]
MFVYSNDGHSFHAVDSDYQPAEGEVLFADYATPDQLAAAFPGYSPPTEAAADRRLVPKRIIVDRLYAAGLLDKAKAAIDAADLYTQERWNSRTDIYADDPTALAMLAVIGGDPAVIFAA